MLCTSDDLIELQIFKLENDLCNICIPSIYHFRFEPLITYVIFKAVIFLYELVWWNMWFDQRRWGLNMQACIDTKMEELVSELVSWWWWSRLFRPDLVAIWPYDVEISTAELQGLCVWNSSDLQAASSFRENGHKSDFGSTGPTNWGQAAGAITNSSY